MESIAGGSSCQMSRRGRREMFAQQHERIARPGCAQDSFSLQVDY
jgi:hypothetical protein